MAHNAVVQTNVSGSLVPLSCGFVLVGLYKAPFLSLESPPNLKLAPTRVPHAFII